MRRGSVRFGLVRFRVRFRSLPKLHDSVRFGSIRFGRFGLVSYSFLQYDVSYIVHITPCLVMSCHVTSRHATPRHATPHHVTSRHATSHPHYKLIRLCLALFMQQIPVSVTAYIPLFSSGYYSLLQGAAQAEGGACSVRPAGCPTSETGRFMYGFYYHFNLRFTNHTKLQ